VILTGADHLGLARLAQTFSGDIAIIAGYTASEYPIDSYFHLAEDQVNEGASEPRKNL